MNPDDSTELKKGGLCSVQEGTWKNYNEEGELKETFEYKDGKIIKE